MTTAITLTHLDGRALTTGYFTDAFYAWDWVVESVQREFESTGEVHATDDDLVTLNGVPVAIARRVVSLKCCCC